MPKRYASSTAALPEPPLGTAPPLGQPPEPPIPHLRLDGLAKRAKLLKKSPAGPHLRDILPRTKHGPAAVVSHAPITRKFAQQQQLQQQAQVRARANQQAQPGVLAFAAQGAGAAAAAKATGMLRGSPAPTPAQAPAPKQAPHTPAPPRRGPRPLGAAGPIIPGAQPMQPARAPTTRARVAAHPVPQPAAPPPIRMQPKGTIGPQQPASQKRIVLQGRIRPRTVRKARPGALGGVPPKAPAPPQHIPTQEEHRAYKDAQQKKLLERERKQQQADAQSFRAKGLPDLARKADARADEITHQLEPATAPVTPPSPTPASPAPAKAPPTPHAELPAAPDRTGEGLLRGAARADAAGDRGLRNSLLDRLYRRVVQRERLEQGLEGAAGTAEQVRSPRKRQGFKAEKPREKPTEKKAPRSELDQLAPRQGLARDSASDLRSRLAAAEASAKDRGMTKEGRDYYRREAAKLRKRLRAMEREA